MGFMCYQTGAGLSCAMARQGAACSCCEAFKSIRERLSSSCCCKEPCPFFSLVALGLCLGEALKGILQGVKGGMVGAYWWQKRSWVSTASGVPQFIGTCVWSSAYCFLHCLPRCFVCANSSWGDAAARRGWVGRVGRPVPPLSSVLRGLSGQLLSDPSTDPG